MSPIYLQDGKVLIQNSKVGVGEGCCCWCWEQHCGCMCCKTVKWTLVRESESESDGETTHYSQVDGSCVAYLQIPDSLCVARAKIQCSGYNATQDCDTDCAIVGIEYCVDGGAIESCEWLADPCPGVLVSLTASLDCEQPEAEYELTRGAVLVHTTPPCPPDSPPGGLVCGTHPTEWRIVDQDDDVWFMGDVLLNPNYGYGSTCKDPEVNDCLGVTPYILDDYWLMYGCSQPVGYRKDGEQTLRLQVLGCNGNQWTDVTERCDGTPFGTATRNYLFCSADDQWFEPLQIANAPHVIAPGGCKCLTDPSTGLPVTYEDDLGTTQCRHCGNTMSVAYAAGTGLSYLGHGEPVKFTNRVNDDGRNAWNWEDSEGRFPANIPWDFYWDDKDIVIAGDLYEWKACYGASQAFLAFNSVTVNNATMALSFAANSLTMNSGRLATSACIDPSSRMVATVGSATLNGNSEVLKATIDCSGCEMNDSFVRSEGIINGPCTLNSSSNEGTINGDCSLNDGSYNSGTINGGAVSFDASYNVWLSGQVNSDVPVTFTNGSINESIVDGDAIFDQSQNYYGTITGDATFDNSSLHHGPSVVQGDATFRNGSSCEATVDGDVTLYDDAVFGGAAAAPNATFYGTSSMTGGYVNNAATFNNQSRMTGGWVSSVATFNDDACVTQEIHDDPGTYAGSFSPDPPPVCSP